MHSSCRAASQGGDSPHQRGAGLRSRRRQRGPQRRSCIRASLAAIIAPVPPCTCCASPASIGARVCIGGLHTHAAHLGRGRESGREEPHDAVASGQIWQAFRDTMTRPSAAGCRAGRIVSRVPADPLSMPPLMQCITCRWACFNEHAPHQLHQRRCANCGPDWRGLRGWSAAARRGDHDLRRRLDIATDPARRGAAAGTIADRPAIDRAGASVRAGAPPTACAGSIGPAFMVALAPPDRFVTLCARRMARADFGPVLGPPGPGWNTPASPDAP